MTPGKFKKKFDDMLFFNDLKALKEISPTDDVFVKVKQEVMNNYNARKRDIMNTKNYVAEDLLGFTLPDLSTIDRMLLPSPKIADKAPGVLAIGMRVEFGAMGHVHDKRFGKIIQQRRGQFLVELDIYHRPDRKGNTTGTKVQMWAEAIYLREVVNAAA